MRKDILIKRVKEEAKNLKKFAMKKELKKLSFFNLNPRNSEFCIYGQATGYCTSSRAVDLITKCCKKVYTSLLEEDLFIEPKLNGAPKGRHIGRLAYLSPIEIFIAQPENREVNNKILIDYLKGKRKDLRFVYPKKR